MAPGPDTALVLRTAVGQGRWAAYRVAVGCCLGVQVWALVAAAAAPVIAGSPLGVRWLAMLGAAYLSWLAIAPWRRKSGAMGPPRQLPRIGMREGFVSNVLNPKIGVFYLSVLQPFIPAHARRATYMFTLASIQNLEALTWFAILLLGAGTLLPAPESRGAQVMDGVLSLVLLACAVAIVSSALR